MRRTPSLLTATPDADEEPEVGDPFPTLEEGDGMGEMSMAVDPETVDFSQHVPAGLGARAPSPLAGMFGQPAAVNESTGDGLPTRVPMWQHAKTQPAIQQLKVFYLDPSGVRTAAGACPAGISEAEFIDRFFQIMPPPDGNPIRFFVRPVDRAGMEMGTETALPPISPLHTDLVDARRRRAVSNGGAVSAGFGFGFGGNDKYLDAILKMQESRARDAREERDAVTAALTRAEEKAHEARELAAKTLADGATVTGRSIEAITERMLKADQDRAAQALTMVQKVAETAQESTARQLDEERARRVSDIERERTRAESDRLAMESRLERERTEAADRRQRDQADEAARRDRERAEMDARLQREREEMKAREADAIRRADEREKDRQRQHDLRLAEMKLEAQARADREQREADQRREHDRKMHELTLERTKVNTGQSFLEQAAALLATFGMKPADLLALIKGDGDEASASTITEIGSSVRELIGGVKEVVKAGIEVRAKEAQAQAQIASSQAALQAIGGPTYVVGASAGVIGTTAQSPAQSQVAPAQPPTVQQQEAQPVTAPPAAALTSDLPLLVQKQARNDLRGLVATLRGSPQDRWQDAISNVVAASNELRTYVQAVGLRPAAREAGAPADMIEQLVAAITEHPIIKMAGIQLNLGV